MNYDQNISRLRKLILELNKEENFFSVEKEKYNNEIKETKKIYQEKISKILETKNKKLKNKELKIEELKDEKMKILGSIFLMFTQCKISKEELDFAANIENNLEENSVTTDNTDTNQINNI